MMVNRRLIVKGEGIHASSSNFDGSVAAGSLIWNLGQVEAFRQTMKLVNWEISEPSLKKLAVQSKKQAAKSVKNLALKPVIRAKRTANQAQYRSTASYRTSKEQASDLAAQTIKRQRKKQ